MAGMRMGRPLGQAAASGMTDPAASAPFPEGNSVNSRSPSGPVDSPAARSM